jgi:FKBP-type peptidyl-prolyl cis-trans isomerase
MKFTTQLMAGLVSLGLLASASAQDAVKFNVPGVTTPSTSSTPAKPATTAPAAAPVNAPAAAPVVAPPAPKYTVAQMMEVYGLMLAVRAGMPELEFSAADIDSIAKGMKMALAGQEPQVDMQAISVQLQDLLGGRQQAFLTKLRAAQVAAGNALFAKLKQEKDVTILPSGLAYKVTKPGTGAVPKLGQMVSINYTGALSTGQVFDSNAESGQPVEILLQVATAESPKGVIAGFVEGLQKVGVGGKITLYIPPALGYGEQMVPGIPPGSTLVFDVEVVGAKEAPKEPAAK